nr:Chromate resistance protein ChrB [Amycolatopsis echigonensis]
MEKRLVLVALFTADREDKWREFLADRGKCDAEIDKEIQSREFTMAEPGGRGAKARTPGPLAPRPESPRGVQLPVRSRGGAAAEPLRRAARRLP